MSKVKKTLTVLSILFIFQFATSCFWGCNCGKSSTYNAIFTELELILYNTSGTTIKPLEGSAYKNSFAIFMDPQFEAEIISTITPKGKWGFSSALACDCVGTMYLFPDPVESVNILMTDLDSGEETDATDRFAIKSYSSDMVPISEFTFERHNQLIELVDFETVPNNVQFEVIATLKSGIELVKETPEIYFY